MSSLSMSWPFALVTFLLPFLFLLLQRVTNKSKLHIKLPPGPPKLPIIGNLHQLGKLPHVSLLRLSETYGSIMLLQFGAVPTLVVSSAAAAKQILNTHDLDFCTRPQSPGRRQFSYDYLNVGFAPYSDTWRETRRIYVSAIHSAWMTRAINSARQDEVGILIGELELASFSLSPSIDMGEKLGVLADRIVGRAALGKRYRGMRFENGRPMQAWRDATEVLFGVLAEDFFARVGWTVDVLTGHHGLVERSFRSLDGFFQMVIDALIDPTRLKPACEGIVDAFIGLVSKDPDGRFAHRHVKTFLMNTFIAGARTTAVTITWAMTDFIRNPAVMNKLQAEIRNFVGKKPRLEQNDVAGLKYLKSVVKETLRLHPPAPFLIPREAIRRCKITAASDDDVEGYDIFPATKVLVNAYAIGRDPEIWKDPLEFYPERFEEMGLDFRGRHFELIPFGSGRRICPGITIATATVEYTLASLLYSFDWEVPSGIEREHVSMEEGVGGLVVHKKKPLHLVPIKHSRQE